MNIQSKNTAKIYNTLKTNATPPIISMSIELNHAPDNNNKIEKINANITNIPPNIWLIIKKDKYIDKPQNYAMELRKEYKEYIPIFTKELKTTGRIFILATYETFLSKYKKIPEKDRCYYELIPEGERCALYVDAEFYRKHNKHIDDCKITKDFIICCKKLIGETFGFSGHLVKACVLDSSNEIKYSKHFIFKVKGKMFKNFLHVKKLMEIMEERYIKYFWGWNKDRTKKNFIADMSVYSKNRQIRLYKSSKFDQNRFLEYGNDNNSIVRDDIFYK